MLFFLGVSSVGSISFQGISDPLTDRTAAYLNTAQHPCDAPKREAQGEKEESPPVSESSGS